MAPRMKKWAPKEHPIPAHITAWCKKNAEPRSLTNLKHSCFKPEKFPRGKKLNITAAWYQRHLEYFAEPFPDYSVEHNRSQINLISKAALNYTPTEHILQLSVPREHIIQPLVYLPQPISNNALNHKLSKREAELSVPTARRNPIPRPVPTVVSEAAKNATASPRTLEISKNSKRMVTKKYKRVRPKHYVKEAALNASASPRTLEMAQPRDRRDRTTKKHPFDVSKGALKYECTDAIRKLCKVPRHRRGTKYVNPEDKWRHRFERVSEEDAKSKPADDKKADKSGSGEGEEEG